jgi:hypothetical protein
VSSTLAVELETGPIERARADLAIVCFSTRIGRCGERGRADWRLCGWLSADRRGRVEVTPGRVPLLRGRRVRLRAARAAGGSGGLAPGRGAASFARDAGTKALRAATLALALPREPGDLALRLRRRPSSRRRRSAWRRRGAGP